MFIFEYPTSVLWTLTSWEPAEFSAKLQTIWVSVIEVILQWAFPMVTWARALLYIILKINYFRNWKNWL